MGDLLVTVATVREALQVLAERGTNIPNVETFFATYTGPPEDQKCKSKAEEDPLRHWAQECKEVITAMLPLGIRVAVITMAAPVDSREAPPVVAVLQEGLPAG